MSLLFLLPIIVTLVKSSCENKTITCQSYDGKASTARCQTDAEILVSCGVKINSATEHISNGVEMTDNYCRIEYDSSKNTSKPLPIPVARCCTFESCYPAFDCKLSVKRSIYNAPNAQCQQDHQYTYPHLLSCTVQTNKYHNNTYQGIWYSNLATNYQMRTDYCNLFNFNPSLGDCGTLAPSKSPTRSPTTSPTKTTKSPTPKPTTKSPTTKSTTNPTKTSKSPSAKPTDLPTPGPTQSPTKVTNAPTESPIPIAYITQQATNDNYCTLERDDNSNHLWLYSLCCSDSGDTFRPSPGPTYAPTNVPTQPTTYPTHNKFSDGKFVTWSSPLFPLETSESQPATTREAQFTDIGDGYVDELQWGVSDESRFYGLDATNGIKEIHKHPEKYYFTIKKYKLRSGKQFKGEYGNIFLPDEGNGICTNIPKLTVDPNINTENIVKIHVFVNETTKEIEGMYMERRSGKNYTCHVDMARKKNSSTAFQLQLYENDINITGNKNTVDVSGCEQSGLTGFFGIAGIHPENKLNKSGQYGLGIEAIGFQFVASGSATLSQSCPIEVTVSEAPTTSKPTFDPTPAPTAAPTFAPTAVPTVAPTKATNSDHGLEFKCYWVMAKGTATCNTFTTENKPFMTNCIGYSLTGQPNSWYIKLNKDEIDECIVEGYKGKNENMSAIATCCHLKSPVPKPSACDIGNEWNTKITWTKNEKICKTFPIPDFYFGLCIIIIVLMLVMCGGGIAFCVIMTRKRNEREAKQKRIRRKPLIRKDRDNEDVAMLTDEQKEDRIALERFKVDEDDHREMLQRQQLISSRDIGLI